MIKIYGAPETRAYRCLWCLRELGVAYEHVPTPFKTSRTDADLLAVNPNGRVPGLLDGDLALFESMAINLYLARRYGEGTPLALRSLEHEAQTNAWSYWAMTEVEAPLLDVLAHGLTLPEEKRDAAKLEVARKKLERPFAVLDAHLARSPYLLGDTFGLADLNVASVLGWGKMARFDFSPWPHVLPWLNLCVKREAAVAARKG